MDTILIDTIRISGFRGIKNLEMSLPRITVLIGTNNSGKTSIIKSLQLALGDYARYLSEEDFFIGSDKKRAAEIVIDIRIVPQDSEGSRIQAFSEEWAAEFGDKIKFEANGYQFVAVRTKAKSDKKKGGFDVSRATLEKWPNFSDWLTAKNKETPMSTRLLSMPFISVEAQRDVYQELRDKSSFIGKILSHVEYDETEMGALEELIGEVNQQAIDKSQVLKEFKTNLEQLKQPFQGAGNVEITPFPKKLRDLSKHFSLYFGEDRSGVFSMEYHGMGTRSWASIITLMSFVDLLAVEYEKEADPYFPILAAEEPEAHLHPNAQKTLYNQLSKSKGQVIVSTHSPYFSAMSDISHIRSLRKETGNIRVFRLSDNISLNEKKILSREVATQKGEILFSNALILCEGITEEQIIPAMFDIFIGKSLSNFGISCVNVGGKNYPPYLKLACSLGIPTYIISDNDGTTNKEVEAQLRRIRKEVNLGSDIFGISYLGNNNDFEAELLHIGLRDEIISALVLSETKASDNIRYRKAKYKELSSKTDDQILSIMRERKSSYSGFLSDIIRENPNSRNIDKMIPAAVSNAFNAIKKWFSI